MKKLLCAVLAAVMLAGCSAAPAGTTPPESSAADSAAVRWQLHKGGLEISAPDGLAENAIAAEKMTDHTVVRISAPGTYILSGKPDAGQIAVDLGEGAKDDPNAVVTLVLDGLDITCPAAPAVMFYNVWESDTPGGPAGANVILADGSQNFVNGSHTEDYDGALYSRMSMTLGGTGALGITADNEGLCSERHLTVNSGDITIASGNDGINTNEDGVSVATVNGGHLRITVTGETGEGDGIDSNGWLIINGGTLEAYACADSGDFGLDADLGVQISGGTVIATGNMPGRIDDGGQTHGFFSFAERQQGGVYTLKGQDSAPVLEAQTPNAFTCLLLSSPDLTAGNYTLWSGDTQFEGTAGLGGLVGPIEPIERPEFPGKGGGDVEIPPQPTNPVVTHGTVQQPVSGDRPADMPVAQFPADSQGRMPGGPVPQEGENMPMPQLPEGVTPPQGGFGREPVQVITGTMSTEFPVREGANYFMNLRPAA